MSDTKQNQIDIIKADLLAGRPVNSLAYFSLGITRLSSIIERLRKHCWPIITVRRKGNGLADYSLPEGWQPSDAEKPRHTLKA